MSPDPVRDTQSLNPETSRLQADSSEPAPSRTRALLTTAGRAAATIAGRTLGFGVLGFVLGLVLFAVELGTGALRTPPGDAWRYGIYLLCPLYLAAGVVGLGAAGMWRGIGRVAMNLVEQHRLSQHLVERVIERAALLAEGAATPAVLHKPLPIQKLRALIHEASERTAADEEGYSSLGALSRAILGKVRRGVVGLIEKRLDALIGEQAHDASTVELTLARLNDLAREQLQQWVLDALDGARNKQALLWSGLFVAVVALPPLALAALR